MAAVRRPGLAVVGILAAFGAAAAAPGPALQPQRDVDVTYRVPVPGPGDASLLQRLRWSASARAQRVDLPTSGQWMVMDFARHRMKLVRDDTRQVLDLPAPDSAGQPGGGAGFSRQGSAIVAGLPCTEWRTVDTRGRETVACYTDDGVLLRAQAGGHVLMEAISVKYGPQPADIFVPPTGYASQQTNR
jgi:hypothetical protein